MGPFGSFLLVITMKFASLSASKLILTAFLASAVTLGASPARAEKGGGKPEWAGGKHGRDHQRGAKQGGARQGGHDDAGSVLAAGATAAAVSALLGGQTRPLAVGASPLPPGIRKNLARGKPLPPGLAKQAVPGPLLARLPVVDGHTWIRVGTELVLIGIATSIISQVIDDVFS